jgi:hypothetical protein
MGWGPIALAVSAMMAARGMVLKALMPGSEIAIGLGLWGAH